MIKKLFYILPLFISACSNWTSTKEYISPTEYNPQKHARIRLIGGNDRPAIIVVGGFCKTNSNTDTINVGGFDDAIGDPQKKILRLGMQATENSQIAEKSKLVYRELIIPADTAITIIPYISQSKMKCTQSGVCFIETTNSCIGQAPNSKWWLPIYSSTYYWKSFFPKAGHDYEYDSKSCHVQLWDITQEPEKLEMHLCN